MIEDVLDKENACEPNQDARFNEYTELKGIYCTVGTFLDQIKTNEGTSEQRLVTGDVL